MNKREFLKTTSLLGLATLIPLPKSVNAKPVNPNGGCVLIPSETAGPFPLDLTANTFYYRQDIRENKPGVQLNLRLHINGNIDCLPMENLRVNIWHCDKDGLYSGYQTETGLTYLRGYQITDVYGEVEFITIFPGWYPGRICHIHFQVYVSSSYSAISQLSFDVATKQAIYNANPTVYTNGPDPTTFNADNIFSDGYAYQVASLIPNANGGYDGYLEMTIQGSGTTGIGHLEKENAKQFVLGQNFPNPYTTETSIPLRLQFPSNVSLEIFNVQGKQIRTVLNTNLNAGEHIIPVSLAELEIPAGNYAYQLTVKNSNGEFKDVKLMTCNKN
jgi:protocatechuate 3,4-dioxygenase beta subunit